MQRFIVLFICAIVWSTSAFAASPNDEVTAQVTKFIDSFNKGDVKAAEATHTEKGVVIIDEVAPYLWQGTRLVQELARRPRQARQGARHYRRQSDAQRRSPAWKSKAIAPMSSFPSAYTFKQKGVAMKEAAQMTFALRKGGAGWKINGWSFTGPTPTTGST